MIPALILAHTVLGPIVTIGQGLSTVSSAGSNWSVGGSTFGAHAHLITGLHYDHVIDTLPMSVVLVFGHDYLS